MIRLPILSLFFLVTLPLFADERILSYDSRIVVKKGGDLVVTETIKVRAEGVEIKRGIYRDIPRLQRTKWGLKKEKPFKVESVKQNGVMAHFITKPIGKGGIRIQIGREETLLKHGEHTYEITYRTAQQLHFEAGRDALYWNVNGTEWGFPTDKVTATVVLPEGIVGTKIWGYTGKKGAKGADWKAELTPEGGVIEATRAFKKKENLTLLIEWPPGLLDARAYEEGKQALFKDHPAVILALALLGSAFLYYLVAWLMVGKDPDEGIIFPHYGPPEGFSPAAVRYLDRMAYDNTCFSAGVVALAVKGVATIEQEGSKYTLRKRDLDEQKEPLDPDEAALYNKLLAHGSIELKQSNHTQIGGSRKQQQKILSSQLEKVHFVRNLWWWLPGLLLSLAGTLVLIMATGANQTSLFMMVWLSGWTVGTAALLSRVVGLWRSGSVGPALGATLFALPFSLGWIAGAVVLWINASAWAGGGIIYAAVLNLIFYHLIKAPTHLGRKIMDHIDGFRQYLSVAEEDRLNMANAPHKTPELFERFLPYALALGCEQKWAEKFDRVLQAAGTAPGQSGGHVHSYHPSFYSGSGNLGGLGGIAAMSGALTGALASSASAPSSSGGGGGGGSGGGGGGGGGGGW